MVTIFSSYKFKNMDAIIQSAKTKLLSGEDGRAVVEWLRTTFVRDEEDGRERKLSSLSCLMTDIRHSFKGETMPPSMETFKLTRDEVIQLKQGQEAAQLKKNENLLVIEDARALLARAEKLLLSAKPTDPNPRLLLPLLLVSGRRLSEMTSPRKLVEHVGLCVRVAVPLEAARVGGCQEAEATHDAPLDGDEFVVVATVQCRGHQGRWDRPRPVVDQRLEQELDVLVESLAPTSPERAPRPSSLALSQRAPHVSLVALVATEGQDDLLLPVVDGDHGDVVACLGCPCRIGLDEAAG